MNELYSLKEKEEALIRDGQIFAYVYSAVDEVLHVGNLQKRAMVLFSGSDTSHFYVMYLIFSNSVSESDHPLDNQNDAETQTQSIGKVFSEAFMHENALNPMIFASLRKFEVRACFADMAGNVLNFVPKSKHRALFHELRVYGERNK